MALQTRAMGTALNGSPTDHVAIVTGGSRGVGRAAIGRLAARGYAVVVNYLHDQRAAESTVEAILAGNGNAVAVRADIADDLDVDRLFAETIAAFGGIDVVIHAAGSRVTASAVTRPAWTSSMHWSGSTRGPPSSSTGRQPVTFATVAPSSI